MKKFLAIILFALSSLAFAEASFDEIQSLINSKNYAAASAGLEIIIKNHPNSAKAFYAMAEAQAGLGNLEKAQKALNLAKGIDPTLKFVSEGSVRSLEQAITPQTAKITYEEPSHFWRNFTIFAMTCGFGWACYYFWCVYNRKKDEEDKARAEKEAQWAKEMDEAQAQHDKLKAEREAQAAAEAAKPQPKKTKKQLKEEADALALREATARAEAAEADARRARSASYNSTTPTTTVVNNSSNDMLTGVLIGNMLSNHHETTRVVEREVVRETPSRSSSWDDNSSSSSSGSSSSRSSSWDDDSSSRRSSSWDDSSSSSSSSWDSSSSDSSSSSSWD